MICFNSCFLSLTVLYLGGTSCLYEELFLDLVGMVFLSLGYGGWVGIGLW